MSCIPFLNFILLNHYNLFHLKILSIARLDVIFLLGSIALIEDNHFLSRLILIFIFCILIFLIYVSYLLLDYLILHFFSWGCIRFHRDDRMNDLRYIITRLVSTAAIIIISQLLIYWRSKWITGLENFLGGIRNSRIFSIIFAIRDIVSNFIILKYILVLFYLWWSSMKEMILFNCTLKLSAISSFYSCNFKAFCLPLSLFRT